MNLVMVYLNGEYIECVNVRDDLEKFKEEMEEYCRSDYTNMFDFFSEGGRTLYDATETLEETLDIYDWEECHIVKLRFEKEKADDRQKKDQPRGSRETL